jgi:two-component system, NarL family, nitrate/nitrite response regulator NarL
MSALRILIADDHQAIREGVRRALGKRPDWEVCGEAVDGQDAIDKARFLRPDVIILDVRMPHLSGLEAAPLIKLELPKSKILILSQHSQAQMLPLALGAGANGFVSKYDMDRDLISAITVAIGDERTTGSQVPGSVTQDTGVLAGVGEMGERTRR